MYVNITEEILALKEQQEINSIAFEIKEELKDENYRQELEQEVQRLLALVH